MCGVETTYSKKPNHGWGVAIYINKRHYFTVIVSNLQPSFIKTVFLFPAAEWVPIGRRGLTNKKTIGEYNMSKIIIDVEYFGNAIKSAKGNGVVSTKQMAHLFGCDANQLHKYENGSDLIPYGVLKRIFRYAAKMDEILNEKQS